MPRAFTEAEQRHVEQRLLAVAREHFIRFGYRRASVAAIARAAGIGKGSVYLFVDSKAELFRQVAEAVERGVRARLLEEMRRPFPSPRARLEHFLRFQLETLETQPLLALLTDPQEAAALMRDLPDGALDELRRSDQAFFGRMVRSWRKAGELNVAVAPATVAALSRAFFAMTIQRELIGQDVFPRLMTLLIESVAAHLTSAESRDTLTDARRRARHAGA